MDETKQPAIAPLGEGGDLSPGPGGTGAARKGGGKSALNSMLAGIMEETAQEAEAEKAKLEAELQRKRAEAEEKERREKELRAAELRQRVEEEERRRRELEEVRVRQAEIMRIEELRARGEYEEPEPEPEQKPALANQRPLQSTAQVLAVQKAEGRQRMLVAALVFLVLVVGAGATFWFVSQQEFVDTSNSYARATPTLLEHPDDARAVAFAAIPDPVVEEEAAQPAAPVRRAQPRRTQPAAEQPVRINLGGNLGN